MIWSRPAAALEQECAASMKPETQKPHWVA